MDLLTLILRTNTTAIDWPVLRGLSEKIAYGGRIDYPQDFEKLEELTQEFFDSSMMNNRWSPLNLPIILLNSGDIQVNLSFENSTLKKLIHFALKFTFFRNI